jgi:hypothetical protein
MYVCHISWWRYRLGRWFRSRFDLHLRCQRLAWRHEVKAGCWLFAEGSNPMIDMLRDSDSLEKLLKIARADADALRIDVIDIERARASAEHSLDSLEADVKREEAKMRDSGVVDFAAYLEEICERRRNLRATLTTLIQVEAAARSKGRGAFAEIEKLEHLIEINGLTPKSMALLRSAAGY